MQREFNFFKKSIQHRRFLIIISLIIISIISLGCCDKQATAPAKEKKRIGLMISPQGLNDRSFNDSAYRGLKEAEKRFEITTTIIEPATWQDPEQSLRFFAKQEFDAIIVVGLGFMEALTCIATEHPKQKFYVIDSDETIKNIRGIAFREEEGAFLCGYLGGKISKTNKIGFIGGVSIPVIKRFESGFYAGAKLANPNIEIRTKYVSENFDGFNDSESAAKIADALYKEGLDILFPAAGASTQGVIASAVTNRKYVFGVDNNQDSLAPGLVLTSLVKRVDRVVEIVIEAICKNRLSDIKASYGLSDGALSLTDFQLSQKAIGDTLISELNKLQKDIINGKITVSEKASLVHE